MPPNSPSNNFGAMWQRETTDNFKIKRHLMNTGAYWIGEDEEAGINNVKSRYYLDVPGLGGDRNGVPYPGNFQTCAPRATSRRGSSIVGSRLPTRKPPTAAWCPTGRSMWRRDCFSNAFP
ncbi:MAG TPA: hypothetical protein VGD81_00560 [Opitutaceae bacterium]